MNKITITSIEKIDNGFICLYTCYIKQANKVHKKEYKVFVNSPIQLGRLILRTLD